MWGESERSTLGLSGAGEFLPDLWDESGYRRSTDRHSCAGLSTGSAWRAAGGGGSTACNPLASGFTGCVPFSDMDANFSNGSSVYHGFTANLKKRFSEHYEFLASYTWSHAIDDSTDLQSPLAPQDSFFPSLERSNSLFDQHRTAECSPSRRARYALRPNHRIQIFPDRVLPGAMLCSLCRGRVSQLARSRWQFPAQRRP